MLIRGDGKLVDVFTIMPPLLFAEGLVIVPEVTVALSVLRVDRRCANQDELHYNPGGPRRVHQARVPISQ
ncbi:hypothetical protein LY76DRAFT_337967 [Colletotrichum caudatum]|nr:hypothetical protein LY76DRAFT_337967 [Colletotrichum caudatum]